MAEIGKKIQEQERAFAEALKSDQYDEAQKEVFRDALDSLNYITAFYERKNELPYMTTDAESDWGKTHDWLMGSYLNVHKAQCILDGVELALQTSKAPTETNNSGKCCCRCKTNMQCKSLRVALDGLKKETKIYHVKYTLYNIERLLDTYKCGVAETMVDRIKTVRYGIYDGFWSNGYLDDSDRVAVRMLITELEEFLKSFN